MPPDISPSSCLLLPQGEKDVVVSASVPPLPLRERAGLRGIDVLQICDSGFKR